MVKAGAVDGPNCKADWGPCLMVWKVKAYEGLDCGCVGSRPAAVCRSRWVLMYILVDLCRSICIHIYPYMIVCIFPICMHPFGGFGDFV